MTESNDATLDTQHLTEIITIAVAGLKTTCESVLGLSLSEVNGIIEAPVYEEQTGTVISFMEADGGWNVALVTNRLVATDITRVLLAMEEDEEICGEDLADSLGEVVNILAGFVKEQLHLKGRRLQFGLPIFLEGETWLTHMRKKVQVMCQELQTPEGSSMSLVLFWKPL